MSESTPSGSPPRRIAGPGSAEVAAAVEAIRRLSPLEPRIGLVLGSGMGELAERLQDSSAPAGVDLDCDRIPHFPVSTATSHAGRLHLGHVGGTPTAILQGRVHLYEGYSPQQVAFAVRVLRRLGVETLVLTNAAGGVRHSFEPGDLMFIEDHLDLAGMTGLDPTRGPHDAELGPRFTSLNKAYDRELLELAERVARERGIATTRGVYAFLVGPSFETPAAIRFLRACGVDAVGMSTVPEVVAARQAGMRVLALSCISNLSIDRVDDEATTTAEEVWQNMAAVLPRLERLLAGLAPRLPKG